jgi:type I restriction enzyme M protein
VGGRRENPLLINDPRYAPAGVLAPKSKADLAFTMHMLSWLAVNGTAAIVEFPGVLYRGGAEQKIRQYLVDNNFVDTVIQLPPDLFFGTTIATCIIVLKRSKADNKTLLIDASAEFVRQGTEESPHETCGVDPGLGRRCDHTESRHVARAGYRSAAVLGRSGRRSVSTVPVGEAGAAWRVPPIRAHSRWAIDSPSPVPTLRCAA